MKGRFKMLEIKTYTYGNGSKYYEADMYNKTYNSYGKRIAKAKAEKMIADGEAVLVDMFTRTKKAYLENNNYLVVAKIGHNTTAKPVESLEAAEEHIAQITTEGHLVEAYVLNKDMEKVATADATGKIHYMENKPLENDSIGDEYYLVIAKYQPANTPWGAWSGFDIVKRKFHTPKEAIIFARNTQHFAIATHGDQTQKRFITADIYHIHENTLAGIWRRNKYSIRFDGIEDYDYSEEITNIIKSLGGSKSLNIR